MEIVNLLLIEALIIVCWCWWLRKAKPAEKLFWLSLLLLFFGPISLYLVFCQSTCFNVLGHYRLLVPAIIAAGATLLTATISRVTHLITRKKTVKNTSVMPATLFWWTMLYCFIFMPLYMWFDIAVK